jgi:two-component system C4-dicarboxylate transport sensor histidine kinase DctB
LAYHDRGLLGWSQGSMSPRRWITAVGVFAAIALVAVGVSLVVRQQALTALEKSSGEQLGLLAAGLGSTIDRYMPIPDLIGESTVVQSLAENPLAADRVDAANRFLEAHARSLGGVDAYVLDAAGRTIATSNWRTPESFLGNDYHFRPYYRDAIAGGRGAYYGIGVTTAKPGYFLASCIRNGAVLAGVAVVKISLAPLEATWRAAGEQVVVVDGDGIVFLASDPAWRYRPLHPIDPATRDRLRGERRYFNEPLDPPLIGEGPRTIDPDLQFTGRVDGTSWSILLFRSSAMVWRQTLGAFALTLLGGLVLALAAALAGMHQARLRADRSARQQLEERVDQRTSELRLARDALEAQVAERSRIDGELHRARSQLAQANRLAAIGQTFAGLAHEINQPLIALKMALASCRLLVEQGRNREIGTTLDDMALTVDRVAELASALKQRAGQREHRRVRVELAAEAGRAIDLVRFRAADSGTTIELQARDPAVVIGDPVRLQQVAMNLVLNALDAVAGGARKMVRVSVDCVDGMAELRVADSGPGLSPEQQAHLFEPFFTTKGREGLGLGLAISHTTVGEHGGTFECTANEGGGAVFSVRIPMADPPSSQEAAE